MKTAIVILNWNGREMLERFLPSVVRFSPGKDREIIVADNGSTDDSLAFLTAQYPAIRQVILDRNYGFAEGYNQALSQIQADYFLLLNSDVEVTENWLDPLETILDDDRIIVAVMPKIRAYADREKFEYAGAAGGFIDWLGYPFCRGRVLQSVEKDNGQYDDNAREIFWATGACMLVRRELFREFGGFDASFFAHQEEIDLCWRWKSAGYQVWVEPASTVYHVGGGTLSSDNPRKTYLNFRNNLAMLYKNLSGRSLGWILFFRLCLDGLSALVFLLQGKISHFQSVWQAHRAFFSMRKVLKSKRREIQKHRTTKPSCIYQGSIVWRYYTGRKTSPIK